jgi:hypothetical protein
MPHVSFALGRVVATAAASATLNAADIRAGIDRHHAGDWGELDEHDRHENDLALTKGYRLFSVYRDRTGHKFYVITEADRSVTTVLLPGDY